MSLQRSIFISDIHGHLGPLKQLLDLCVYEKERDRLILMGDYVDRGPNSRGVLRLLSRLSEEGDVVALRGNHDEMFLRWLDCGEPPDYPVGVGHSTLASFGVSVGDLAGAEWARRELRRKAGGEIGFLRKASYYYEDEEVIAVHAGIDPGLVNWRDTSPKDWTTIQERFIRAQLRAGKPVIFGHTCTVRLHGRPGVWFGGDKIGIDGGAAYGLQLNALIRQPDGTFEERWVSLA